MYCIKTADDYIFVNDLRYIKVSPTSSCYIQSSKEEAQGVAVNSVPYSTNVDSPLPNATAAEIVEESNWTDDITAVYQKNLADRAKEIVLDSLSNQCNEAINRGSTVQLSDGIEFFSYDLADQANINEMFNAVVMGATQYPYHANDSECKMYSAQDIIAIYTTLASMKTAQLTYHNQLKAYVNGLEKAEDIYSVTYGQELTGQYLEAYTTLITEAKNQLEAILAKVTANEATA